MKNKKVKKMLPTFEEFIKTNPNAKIPGHFYIVDLSIEENAKF